MAAPVGECRICGGVGPLTFEHIPPEAAFNDEQVFAVNVNNLISASSWADYQKLIVPKKSNGRISQRGVGAHTLCSKCNSRMGRWYGAYYTRWAYTGMEHLLSAPNGSSLRLPYFCCPLNVFKQIMAMFASTCGVSFVARNEKRRSWLLNRHQNGCDPEVRLYAYYISPNSRAYRSSRITGTMTMDKGKHHTFSEISFPPFGYILTFNSDPIRDDLCELTFMSRFSENEYKELYLRMPVLEIHSFVPGSFQSGDDLKAAYNRGADKSPI